MPHPGWVLGHKGRVNYMLLGAITTTPMLGRVTEELNLGNITASFGKETSSTERRMEQRGMWPQTEAERGGGWWLSAPVKPSYNSSMGCLEILLCPGNQTISDQDVFSYCQLNKTSTNKSVLQLYTFQRPLTSLAPFESPLDQGGFSLHKGENGDPERDRHTQGHSVTQCSHFSRHATRGLILCMALHLYRPRLLESDCLQNSAMGQFLPWSVMYSRK